MITAIRELSSEHAVQMAEIAAAAHSHPMSQSTIESCFGTFYRSYGVFDADKLVGFTILHQLFEEATVMDICLAPGSQGKGLGKALMLAGIGWLKQTEAEQLMLEVRASNTSAIGLYQKLGFAITGERKGYYKTADGTEDAVLMTLPLV